MRSSRKLASVAAAALLGLLSLLVIGEAVAAGTSGGLDRSYGHEGVASALPPDERVGFESEFATAPDGSAYLMSITQTCGTSTCVVTRFIHRWAPDGSFDAGFAGTGTLLLPETPPVRLRPESEGAALAVDSQGRLLVSRIEAGAVVVRRYTAAGVLDTSFGVGGAASIPCVECERNEVWLRPAPKGRTLVERRWALPHRPGGFGPSLGGQVALTRLTPGGFPERHYGSAGTVTIQLGSRGLPGMAAVTAKGAALLGSAGCCTDIGPYLIRVSAKGRVDHKFGRAAGRSLARIATQGETSSLTAVLPRANGTIDLVGDDGFEAGFDLRLKANGDRARFGKKGLKPLSFVPQAAALGVGGGIFAIGTRDTEELKAFRLLADGRVDPAFGSAGIAVPLSGSGYSLGTPSRGKVLVFDRGYYECRGSCPPTPAFARFDEGSARG